MEFTGRGLVLLISCHILASPTDWLGPHGAVVIYDYLLLLLAACAYCLLARQTTLDCTDKMRQSQSPYEFITHTKDLVQGDHIVIGPSH